MEGSRDNQGEFEKQWREWATRPPALNPRQAAERIQERIQPRRPAHRSPWALAAAAALVVVALGLVLQVRRPPVSRHLVVGAAVGAPRLGPGEVLMWLDEETPLYMTFQLSDGGLGPGEGP